MNTPLRRALARSTALGAALTLLVLGVAAPAQAAPGEEHCVILLESAAEGAEAVDAVDAVVCAGTMDAAIRKFSAGTGLELAASDQVVAARAVYSLAQLFVNANYGGSSHLITRSTPCDGSTLSSLPNLGSVGLNDAVSSFLTYSGCTVRLFADINYGGATFGYTTSQASLPSFNDVASSVRVR